MDLEIGPFFKSARENGRRLHAHMKKYVTDRKSGVTKSQMEGMDLLSAFLENQDVFSDDAIVEGIKGIIFAAIETTNFSSQTLHSIFAQRNDIVQKVRKEFDDNIRKPALSEDPSLEQLSKADFLEQALNFSVAQDQEYLSYCLQEALRI